MWKQRTVKISSLHQSADDDHSYAAATTTATEDDDDTIYALASAGGGATQVSAVALIRISGSQAPSILRSLLLLGDDDTTTTTGGHHQQQQTFPKPRYASLRRLYHPQTHVPIDQALVLYFPAPHSFTGEDCVELHCHGSRAVIAALLAALDDAPLLRTGNDDDGRRHRRRRLAEPGEFTQRAFANGKLDVLQVEGLADLLASDTDQQRQVALAQLEGHVSAIYRDWRDVLIAALAHAEAIIDFGDDEMNTLEEEEEEADDDDDDAMTTTTTTTDAVWGGVTIQVQSLIDAMRRQLSRSRNAELLRLGVKIAICGPPNAGKSSLFNLLAQRPAAIVSNVAGTTRDVLEVSLDLGGTKCLLQDTAGIRDNDHDADAVDVIEQEGIKRALAAAQSANIVVLMVDAAAAAAVAGGSSGHHRPQPQDVIDTMLPKLLETHEAKDVILVYNKLDLGPASSSLDRHDHHHPVTTTAISSVHRISCVTQQGLDEFLADLTQRVAMDPDDNGLITRARHRQHVTAATEALERFLELSGQGSMAIDLAAEELRLAASELGRITGAVDVEDILDKLFADFCIGK